MYHGSFGPTYQTMQRYVREIFPQYREKEETYTSYSDTLMVKSGQVIK